MTTTLEAPVPLQRTCECERFIYGQPYRDGWCKECWNYYHDAYYRARRGGGPLPATPPTLVRKRPKPPCIHLGRESRREVCATCNGRVELKVFNCRKHGECTVAKRVPGVAGCCADPGCYEAPEEVNPPDFIQAAEPSILTIDPARLLPGRTFNCSLIIHKGRRLLAYRKEWSEARIAIAELGDDWQPISNHRIYWGDGQWGQEDPRLFHFRGELYLSYTGYDSQNTNVGYVRLRDDLTAVQPFMPQLDSRNTWEKNWSFFDHEGELYAVYWSVPHVVLRVEGSRAWRVYEAPWNPQWHWGEMRGGCPPVRVGDEYYHFFHARMPQDNGTYSIGLYTFEARPPFRPLRMIGRPLVLARKEELIDYWTAVVVFPGGAILDGRTWRIGAGFMDALCRIYSFDADEIESELRPV